MTPHAGHAAAETAVLAPPPGITLHPKAQTEPSPSGGGPRVSAPRTEGCSSSSPCLRGPSSWWAHDVVYLSHTGDASEPAGDRGRVCAVSRLRTRQGRLPTSSSFPVLWPLTPDCKELCGRSAGDTDRKNPTAARKGGLDASLWGVLGGEPGSLIPKASGAAAETLGHAHTYVHTHARAHTHTQKKRGGAATESGDG